MNGTIFGKKFIKRKMCWFSLQLLYEIYLILRRIQPNIGYQISWKSVKLEQSSTRLDGPTNGLADRHDEANSLLFANSRTHLKIMKCEVGPVLYQKPHSGRNAGQLRHSSVHCSQCHCVEASSPSCLCSGCFTFGQRAPWHACARDWLIWRSDLKDLAKRKSFLLKPGIEWRFSANWLQRIFFLTQERTQ